MMLEHQLDTSYKNLLEKEVKLDKEMNAYKKLKESY